MALALALALGLVCCVHAFSPRRPMTAVARRLQYTSPSPRAKSSQLRMGFDTIVKVQSSYEAGCNGLQDAGVTLDTYMRLPVDQYVCIKMPLDATLTRVEGNLFDLTVPPVRFFNLDVSPTIHCLVTQDKDSVVIESESVVLSGSPYVVGLNGCYNIKIRTEFKWIDTPAKQAILSSSKIYVEVDPPPPFKYFGRRLLESTGTLALSIALRQIENAFVSSLARDYERWARDAQYRVDRAAACPCDPDEGAGADSSCSLPGTADEPAAAAVVAPAPAPAVAAILPAAAAAPAAPVPAAAAAAVVAPAPAVAAAPEPAPAVAVAAKPSTRAALTPPKATPAPSPSPAPAPSPSVLDLFGAGGYLEGDDANNDGPTVLTDDICLVPGDPVVRIEEAPANARRIFTGVDISASVEEVWAVLVDYDNLSKVIPSLVKNKVLLRLPKGGARLLQVGGAKVLPGVTFTAKIVLDVKLYLEDDPLPLAMQASHLPETASSQEVRDYDLQLPLVRGVFPRPYGITSLPHRDITMQSVEGGGDFDHYQGIWRMQALPNCAPGGGDACRLTYAVEIRPKGFLPVRLIEGRIASDLKANLGSIRAEVEARAAAKAAAGAGAAAGGVGAGGVGAGVDGVDGGAGVSTGGAAGAAVVSAAARGGQGGEAAGAGAGSGTEAEGARAEAKAEAGAVAGAPAVYLDAREGLGSVLAGIQRSAAAAAAAEEREREEEEKRQKEIAAAAAAAAAEAEAAAAATAAAEAVEAAAAADAAKAAAAAEAASAFSWFGIANWFRRDDDAAAAAAAAAAASPQAQLERRNEDLRLRVRELEKEVSRRSSLLKKLARTASRRPGAKGGARGAAVGGGEGEGEGEGDVKQ